MRSEILVTHLFYFCGVSHCMNAPQFIHPLYSCWLLRLFAVFGNYDKCCFIHSSFCLSFIVTLGIYVGVKYQNCWVIGYANIQLQQLLPKHFLKCTNCTSYILMKGPDAPCPHQYGALLVSFVFTHSKCVLICTQFSIP